MINVNALPLEGQGGLLDVLDQIPDPRQPRGVRHPLRSVLAVSVCAVLSGMRGFTAIAQWAQRLPRATLRRLRCLNRGHWAIENRVHWVRDVTFDEDRSQVRKCNGAHMMASLRNALAGVVGFLKRYVGVRQYWRDGPGGIGDVVPSRPTLRVPEVEWRDWPYFLSRYIGMGPVRWDIGEVPVRIQRVGLECVTLPCNESYHDWLPPERWGATHPRTVARSHGGRSVPGGTR